MRIATTGIVVSSSNFSESGCLVRCFTPDHGMVSGIIKHAKKNKAKVNFFMPGNVLAICHYSRNDSLGVISGEAIKCYSFRLIQSKYKLRFLSLICEMITFFLQGQGVDHGRLFGQTIDFFEKMDSAETIDLKMRAEYVLFYKNFLAESGYGFNLEKCISTGSSENLTHLSPKSGSAVCEDAAKPYLHLLLKLPKFFISENLDDVVAEVDVRDGLYIVCHFFEKICRTYLHMQAPPVLTKLRDAFH